MQQFNWDSQLPEPMKNKISLLVTERNKLQVLETELQKKSLMKKHQRSILKGSRGFSQNIEKLLEKEKDDLIDILDNELVREVSPFSRSIRKMSQSSISFQDENSFNHKSDKTFRSFSTNFTQHTGIPSPQPSPSNQSNNKLILISQKPKKLPSLHNDDQKDLINSLTSKLKKQEEEIQLLRNNKCNCENVEKYKNEIQQKLQTQREKYQQLIEELQNQIENLKIQQFQSVRNSGDRELFNLKQENQLLIQQLSESEMSKIAIERQMNSFKDSLVQKLSSYAKKLDKFNENEQKLLQFEEENTRLRLEKQGLQIVLRNLGIQNAQK